MLLHITSHNNSKQVVSQSSTNEILSDATDKIYIPVLNHRPLIQGVYNQTDVPGIGIGSNSYINIFIFI